MAPWPEPETEPKAPDKTAATADKPCDAAVASMKNERDATDASAACKPVDDKKDSGVSSLDDQGLQALLDEAISYKIPKDREKKSALFKELLAKAEEDEREHSGGQRGISGIVGSSGRYRRGLSRRGHVSERNSRGGSLQNLAQNSDSDIHGGSANKKRGRRNLQPQVSVSARQIEGGSLPAALHRSHDGVGTSSSVEKRGHFTPIDDVVTGNSYSYKLASASSDVDAAAPRGPGSKRREFKKLGHSTDVVFPDSTSDDISSMEDLSKVDNRLGDIKNENESLMDLRASEFASYCLSRHNNVSDHLSNEDSQHQVNGPPMLGIGLNGSVRSGPDHQWINSDLRKDDDIDGTEMTSFERSCDNPKFRSKDHEVDACITSDFLSRKPTRSNGEAVVQVSPFNLFPSEFTGGDSMRSALVGETTLAGDKSATRARTLFQVSSLDKNMQLYRVESPLPRLPFLTKESEKKSFDENGNALHQGSGSERKFKTRKNKTDNNNYVLSQSIPGHRGGTQDINELLNFIESPSNCQDVKSSVSGKNNRNSNGPVTLKESKQRNNSSNGKRNEGAGPKLKAEKRKSNEKQKLKKSNSLEEISCTKLSDLTSSDNSTSAKGILERQPKKQLTLEEDVSSRESRSKDVRRSGTSGSASDRGSGSSSASRRQKELSSNRISSPYESMDPQVSTLIQGGELLIGDPSEFHVVTKKQRKKKSGRSSSIGRNERSQHNAQSNNYHRETHSRRSATVDDSDGNILYQYRSAPYRSESPEHSQHHRRKSTSSMPPSDKSADSSDLDSVHSLPISSTTPKPVLDKTSTSSGSTPQASYADIARMAAAMSPPQGQVCPFVPPSPNQSEASSHGLPCNKWPSVGQARPPPPSAPLWTANVTLHTATLLPASHEEGDQCLPAPVPAVPSSTVSSSTKRDAMTNTSSPPESESTDCSTVGNLLSDVSYPPLCESGKSQAVLPQSVTQCVQTFISQASRTSPALSPGVTMANCVDVEDSAKRAASPATFDSVRESSRTSASDRPAVIILDEAETETPVNGDPELTFGFEINEMLLSGSCTISSDEETDVKRESSPPVKMQPTISSLEHINLDKIVAFVGRAWEDVIKELPREAGVRGRVQFYNGQ